MGRIETWIDRVMGARRRRRSGDARGARRRHLRFEQFEARLALSAAASTEPSLDAVDVVRTQGQFLHGLWSATPGSAQWGEVTFSTPQPFAPLGSEWSESPTVRARLETFSIDSVRGSFHGEGGFVGSDSLLQFATTTSAMVSRGTQVDSNFSHNGAFSGIGAFNGSGIDLLGHVLDSVDAAGIYIDPSPGSFNPSWSGGKNSPFDAGDGLSSAGSGGGVAGTDEANVTLIESPVLRITAPLPSSDDEGGAIDVTAMVAPRALFAAQNATALAATSGVRPGSSLVAERQASMKRISADAADGDELRARAVVYEVSLAHEATDDSLDETRAERTPASPAAPRAPQATEPAPAPAVSDAHGEIAADVVAPQSTDGEAAKWQQTSSAAKRGAEQREAIAARDAALARLDDEFSLRPTADLESASSRNQTLGLALAVVVGAGPLVQRVRRARASKIVEQAGGLR